MREQARFALRADEERRLLPHGKAIRLQVGGIRGLIKVLDPRAPTSKSVDDVDAMLAAAEKKFHDLKNAPFSEIMREVAAYQVRKRSRRRR